MATLQQLEQALIGAHQAGDTDAARKLAAVLKQERATREGDTLYQIPEVREADVPGTVPQAPEPTVGDIATGAGEAALAIGTGATGGAIGMIGGTLQGLAEEILAGKFGTQEAASRIEQQAAEGAQALTYAPRTETGQQIVQTIGEVTEPLVAVAPLAEAGMAARASQGAAPLARAAARERVIDPALDVAQRAKAAVTERIKPADSATAGTGRAGGAAAADLARVRAEQAQELPVPIQLTEGQKTRDFDQQRFERETAKREDIGAPIRERYRQQNEKLTQNFDAFLDSIGAELDAPRDVGKIVDTALRSRAARDKRKIRTLYKEAEKAGEMEAPVEVSALVKHLNESGPEAEVANVLKAARAKAIQLGAAIEGPDGDLMPSAVSLKNAELLRRSINNATNQEPTNIRQASIMKGLIDSDTEGAGGDAYRAARAARARYGKEYENVGLIKQLLGTKRGTDDRVIALEDVVNRSILSPSTSLDIVRKVRSLLQTEGEQGKQAWKELQGGTLRHIRDQALKSVTTDEAGNRILSPSQLDRVITQLDKSGKLDFVFGKKGAEQLRTLNEVAQVVATAPPGVINTSNTAAVLAGMMDLVISGSAGIPAPVASAFRALGSHIKDAKLKAKVKKALGDQNE